MTVRRTLPLPIGRVVAVAGWALLAIGCGGGGGDGVVDDEPIILPEYRFAVTGQQGGLLVSIEEGVLGLDPDPGKGPGLIGTIHVTTGTVRVGVGSLIEILDPSSVLFGDLDVEVIEEVVLPDASNPTAGRVEVSDGEDVVTVRVVSAPAGVAVSLNGGPETPVDWDTFLDAIGGGVVVPEIVMIGSLGFGAIRVLLELMDVVVQSFDVIDIELETTNPLSVTGSGFAPTWPAPAEVAFDPGRYDVHWIDELADGEVGPGDSFSWVFFDYWVGNPSLEDLPYRNGRIELENFTQVVDTANRLVRIGFEPYGGPGGVGFDDFAMGDVWIDMGEGVLDVSTLWNGRVVVVFFE